MVPFITERLYQDLVVRPGADGPDSVHLADFPTADESLIDRDLEEAIAVVRRVVSAGHALRKRHSLRVRQPLSRLTVITHDDRAAAAVRQHADLIADELNVRAVETSRDDAGLADLSAKADFRRLGPRLGADVKACAAGIAALGNEEIARLLAGETLEVAGFPITAEDVVVTRTPREGTVVETDGELAVALDTRLDDDLIAEGLARDVVNRIQQVRRGAGLDVADRIRLRWTTDDERLRRAVERHRDYIARETLATEFVQADGLEGQSVEVDGAALVVAVEKA